jgi:hypothetical protein
MLFQRVLGSNYDLHVVRWQSGTFFTKFHYYLSREGCIIRAGRVELELSQRPTNKQTDKKEVLNNEYYK